MSDWITFYDFKHSVIYVNARHRDVHYRKIAEDIRAYVPRHSGNVLDYGCGEASSADLIAAAAAHLTLVEAAPNVRASLKARHESNPKISVLTPDEAAALPAGSLDLIVLHSVAQYLSGPELDRSLAIFRKLIKPDGLLVVGDIVPPQSRRAEGGGIAAQMRRRQRIFLGGGRRARADFRVGLSAAEKERRPVALRSGGDAGQAQGRGLCRATRAAQYRPQSLAHDVPGAAGLRRGGG